MKMMDAFFIKDTLLKITNPDSRVKECIAYLDREIALREKQTQAGRLNKTDIYIIANKRI